MVVDLLWYHDRGWRRCCRVFSLWGLRFVFISQLLYRFFSWNFSLFLEAFGSHLEKLIILLYFSACSFTESFYHPTDTSGSFCCININGFLSTLYASVLMVKWNGRLGTSWTLLYGQKVKSLVKGCDMQHLILLLLGLSTFLVSVSVCKIVIILLLLVK